MKSILKGTVSIRQMAAQVHANAKEKGFHPEGEALGDFVAKTTANIHAETSEFWEAFRNNTLDAHCDKWDKGCHLTCAEEELADIVIRAFDTAERLGIDLERAIVLKHSYNQTRAFRHGGKLA